MDKIINIYKPSSMTPIQAIDLFRSKNPKYKKISISHAGRLDPLAKGVLILITGDETKNIGKYMKLPKVYQAQVLIGISTDSYDLQGIPKIIDTIKEIEKEDIIKAINSLKSIKTQSIPAFSSKKIGKTKLLKLARKGLVKKSTLPIQNISIKKIKINKVFTISIQNILNKVKYSMNRLIGDFRQEEIIKSWEKICEEIKDKRFPVIDLTISCSSGTYIRSIAEQIGKDIGTSALLYELTRTKVDNYNIKDSIRLRK